jgi:hypothetical protein
LSENKNGRHINTFISVVKRDDTAKKHKQLTFIVINIKTTFKTTLYNNSPHLSGCIFPAPIQTEALPIPNVATNCKKYNWE